jgi:hypothetical protein
MIERFLHFANKYYQILSLEIDKTTSQAKRDKLSAEIFQQVYGLKGKNRTLKEIALLTDLTYESIRLKKKKILLDIRTIISSEKEKNIYEYDKNEIDFFIKYLKENRVISLQEFQSKIKQDFDIDYEDFIGPFNLLFDLFEIEIRTPTTHLLSKNTFIFTDKNISIKDFIELSYVIYLEVEKSIIPLNIEDLLISIKQKSSSYKNDLIILAAEAIDEFETVEKFGDKHYQIKFHKLSATSDMAYRLLFNRGEKMKSAEILKEINHLLVNSPRKRVTKVSLGAQLNGDTKFTPHGKLGIWSLTEWGEENLSIFDLITNTFNLYNKPLTKKFIVDHIRKNRPFIPKRTIESYLYHKNFIQLKHSKFILSDWKELYKKDVINKKSIIRIQKPNLIKDQIKIQIVSLFKENNLSEINLNIIKKTLNQKFGFPTASIYKCISENNEFSTENISSNKKVVRMKLTKESTSTPTKSTSVFISYSWDNKDYQERVISFVNFLRQKGFMADLDIKLMQEESSPDFNKLMHKGILNYDKVIILLSETYKNKAENFEGGVGKEYSFIIKDIVRNKNKYIFASFDEINSETISKIAPIEFSSRSIISLKKDENNKFKELFSKLTDSKNYIFSDVASKTPLIEPEEIKPFTLK